MGKGRKIDEVTMSILTYREEKRGEGRGGEGWEGVWRGGASNNFPP